MVVGKDDESVEVEESVEKVEVYVKVSCTTVATGSCVAILDVGDIVEDVETASGLDKVNVSDVVVNDQVMVEVETISGSVIVSESDAVVDTALVEVGAVSVAVLKVECFFFFLCSAGPVLAEVEVFDVIGATLGQLFIVIVLVGLVVLVVL